MIQRYGSEDHFPLIMQSRESVVASFDESVSKGTGIIYLYEAKCIRVGQAYPSIPEMLHIMFIKQQ